MKHLGRQILVGLVAVAGLGVRPVRASDLDAATGLIKSTDKKAVMIGFEDASQLAKLGVGLTTFMTMGGMGRSATLGFLDAGGAAITAAELKAHTATDVAAEGSRALLVGAGPGDNAVGVLVPWSKLAPLVTSQKIVVSVWARAYGATPTLAVTYGNGTPPVAGSFTGVTAIRTGRETSDGWAELSTGPIDTSVWGVPLAQITVGLGGSDLRRNANAALVIDALEIAPVADAPLPADACTFATQDRDCGPDGECQFGHCLPASASWGPLPSAAHRAELVDRWISLAKHVHGARNAAKNADAMVAARPGLTADSVGVRQFFAGMNGLVNGLRNQHTSFGTPPNNGLLQPLAEGGSSSILGACAGFGELDLFDHPRHPRGTIGFILYQVAKTSPIGAQLQVGDAITAIDGMDPLAWVKSVFLTYAPSVPSDPGADLAWSATGVVWMISHRANTVHITRCAPATNCRGSNRVEMDIDVASPAWKNVQGTGLIGSENDPNVLGCSNRFQVAVTTMAMGSGGNTVNTQTIWNDVSALQFDGTLADFTTWESQVLPAFANSPTKVLFDVRQGDGGYAENSELIAEEIRSPSQPIGEIGFPVASWDGSATTANLVSMVQAAKPSCESPRTFSDSNGMPCDFVDGDYFIGDYYPQVSVLEGAMTPLMSFTPGGLQARVAWLQGADVSANDYLAALIQGRENQRVFAPGPTSGSYGTISSISAPLVGWRGGSIQMTDSLWASSPDAMASQSFRSGTGVLPDEIIAEKMSDAMNGVDSMLAAAQAWLEAGNP
jgi:hypothetical protein